MVARREKWAVGAVLALPLALTAAAYAQRPDAVPDDLLHPTGEWSARFLIIALMVTPLRTLWPQVALVRGLARHRRALGVSAFLYAVIHTIAYLIEMGVVADILAELGAPGIWTGWLALLLLLPLALTSNDAAVRALGRGWKRLQRLAYPAAVLTLLHWALVHGGIAAALIHFLPLALLQAVRVAKSLFPKPRSFA